MSFQTEHWVITLLSATERGWWLVLPIVGLVAWQFRKNLEGEGRLKNLESELDALSHYHKSEMDALSHYHKSGIAELAALMANLQEDMTKVRIAVAFMEGKQKNESR